MKSINFIILYQLTGGFLKILFHVFLVTFTAANSFFPLKMDFLQNRFIREY